MVMLRSTKLDADVARDSSMAREPGAKQRHFTCSCTASNGESIERPRRSDADFAQEGIRYGSTLTRHNLAVPGRAWCRSGGAGRTAEKDRSHGCVRQGGIELRAVVHDCGARRCLSGGRRYAAQDEAGQ